MNAKSKATHETWVDPDDAPELTEEFFATATPTIAGRVVSREEFRAAIAEALKKYSAHAPEGPCAPIAKK